MTTPKLSLRLSILIIAVTAVGLTIIHWNDPAVRYRRTGDADAFYATLKDQLKNGDPVSKVVRLLGTGGRITDPKIHAYYVSYARRNPSENPQGGRDTDEFFSYPTGGWNIVLQVRDGRLINFNPTDYPLKTGDILGH